MNAVKLARALRLAAEALEEDQGALVDQPLRAFLGRLHLRVFGTLGPFVRRRRVRRATREEVIARDGLVCHLCGLAVARTEMHLDHLQPFSRGGSDAPENLRVAHALCNVRRGNRELVT